MIACSTRDEWSQAPCLMTSQPAPPATTTLVEAAHPGAPGEMPHVAARIEVRNVVAAAIPEADLMLGAELIARASVVVRCWHRRSRGCPNRRSPKA
jgi:hypothetical protein